MKITIYDWIGNPKVCDIEDKPIKSFKVTINAGDEIVTIMFEDGAMETFDSSSDRYLDYFDGVYNVAPDRIEEWNSMPKKRNMSYSRQAKWEDEKS